ncbi:LysR substrate binding domain-containing protein, partial [Sphingomonas laterariae]
ISSGRCFLLGIPCLLRNPKYHQFWTTQKGADQTDHNCINLRLPTRGGLYAWEFEKDGRPLNVRVEGQFTCDDVQTNIDAAIDGLGLVCLPNDTVERALGEGHLVRVLEDWCPPFPGYHLYYPSRRQHSPAFNLLVEALRWRE